MTIAHNALRVWIHRYTDNYVWCVQRRLLGLKKVGGGYFSTKMASLCVGGLWALSIVLDGCQFFWSEVITTRRSHRDCKMLNVDRETYRIYFGVKAIFTFFAPLLLVWSSYCGIIYRTHKAFKTVTSSTLYSTVKTKSKTRHLYSALSVADLRGQGASPVLTTNFKGFY